MTDFVVVGARKVAIGMEWHLLTGATSESREIETIAKSLGVRFGCVARNDGGTVAVLGTYEGTSGSKLVSGAAWLAKAVGKEAVLLVEDRGNGYAWVCLARMGMPVPGFDQVVQEDRVHELIGKAMASGDVEIYSTFASVSQYPNAQPRSFAEAVQDVEPPAIKQIQGLPPFVGPIAVLLTLGVLTYFGATTYIDKTRRNAAAEALMSLNAEQSRNQAELEKREQEAHRKKGIAVVNEQVLARSGAKNRLESYTAVVSSLPMNVPGWQMSGYKCEDDLCRVKFERKILGTLQMFEDAAAAFGWKISYLRGNEGIVDFVIEASPRNEDISVVMPEDRFRVVFETRLQELTLATIKYEISAPKRVDADIPVPPQAPGQPPKKMQPLPWQIGKITVKGEASYQVAGLPEYIEASTVAVRLLNVDLKQNNWTMELKYVVR